MVAGNEDNPEETEITPAMIEAGKDVILSHDGVAYGLEFFAADELAELVYRAMDNQRRSAPGANPKRRLPP
jgi:hypothetical protein